MSDIRVVRLCALTSITAVGSVLSWALAETLDPTIVFTGYWFLFLVSLLIPYVAIVWLFDAGKQRSASILGVAWGRVAAFSPLAGSRGSSRCATCFLRRFTWPMPARLVLHCHH